MIVHRLAQFRHVHIAPGIGLHGDDLVAGHRGRRRVRAMRGVRHDDLGPRFTAALEVRADEQQAGELAVRAGRRLERHAIHAAHLGQHALQLPHELERSLRIVFRRVGMKTAEPRQTGDVLVDLRIVLHRARPQRIEALVDAEVAVRQPRVVTHDVEFADLRQRRWGIAQLGFGDERVKWLGRHVGIGVGSADAPGRAQLEDDGQVAAAHRSPSSTPTRRSI
jgi:hypothetical protein